MHNNVNKQRHVQQLFFDPEIEKKKIKNFKNSLDRMRADDYNHIERRSY